MYRLMSRVRLLGFCSQPESKDHAQSCEKRLIASRASAVCRLHDAGKFHATGSKRIRPLPAGLRALLACLVFRAVVGNLAWGADDGPLPPAEAQTRFLIHEDLAFDQVLTEPAIRQPVFLTFDERGRMWVVQYLQYPNPAGLKILSHDKFWRAVYDKVPDPPPNHVRGLDKITIHEDTDGDGLYDKHVTFVEGLNIATACATGRGGVWVLNPPYLLFYPDANNDDAPDGDPVVHLSGFGLEDTHAVVNSLCWGPDGWLYAAQGSTVSAAIKRPDDKRVVNSLGQLIWRYHPESKRYEIFAEGGGNAFGVEIDNLGRVFSGTNGGDARGYHYVQGAYLQKAFGKHGPLSNPFSFGYFPAMKHHQAQRFTHNFCIYEGGALPERYRGRMLAIAPLLHEVSLSAIDPSGSTFKTHDLARPVSSSDKCFRPVDIKLGPDGAIYVADWYDRLAGHIQYEEGKTDTATGRIYRLRAKNTSPTKPEDMGKLSSTELIKRLDRPNRWQRFMALRLLGDRKDSSLIPTLREQLFTTDGAAALGALWALNLCGGFDEELAFRALGHADPYVRVWTVRLLGDSNDVSSKVGLKLAQLARKEPHVEVRSQLASTAKRLPAGTGLAIVSGLIAHDEDADDPYLPLLIWWAVESKCADEADDVVTLFSDRERWSRKLVREQLLSRLMQRFAATGRRKDLLICARLLKLSPDAEATAQLMRGFEEAFRGRPVGNLPAELAQALSSSGARSEMLALRQGEPAAIDKALRTIADGKADMRERLNYVQTFGEVNQPACVPVLLSALRDSRDPGLQMSVLTALQSYTGDQIGTEVLRSYSSLSEDVRNVALTLLASRKLWALELLSAVNSARVDRSTVPVDLVRRMTVYRDERVQTLIEKHWGTVAGASTAEMQKQTERLVGVLKSGSGGDPYLGEKLFQTHCAKCHTLFGKGGQIGPDLTNFKRDDVENMLLNIINPSAEIREGFETLLVTTVDGRTLSGFLVDRDNQVIVLRGADGQSLTIPQAKVDDIERQKSSLMPEGLLKDFSDQQVRHLFAYLRMTQPLVSVKN